MKSAGPRFEFGDFVLVPDQHVLLRAGAPVRLARKDFDLLVALVDREGGLVRKEELLERLWPATFVEEGNLTKHVSTLRKALADADGARPLIETVPRTGFRFIAPVRRIERTAETRLVGAEPPASPQGSVRVARQRSWIMMLVGATVLAAALVASGILRREAAPPPRDWRAVAILPFQTLGGIEAASDPLGIGLADGIITRLSGQRVLPVRPTSAVLAYAAGPRPDAHTLGRALDAGVLLEGHIRRDGGTVRVTVQLMDAEAGAPIWAETFDQTSSELFKLEDAIAERVAAALRLQLAAVEQERLRRRYTSNAAAYDAYLKGRAAMLRYTHEGAKAALSQFERALALDANYALAWAGAAMASADMYLRYAPESEVQAWGERAERQAADAIALDPDLAEAHMALAAVLRKREFDWDKTIVVSQRAITLNPNLDQPHLFTAAAFYHLGLIDQATAALERGRAVGGPDVVEPLRIESLIALFSGDVARARTRLEDVSQRSSRVIGSTYLALAYYYTGEAARARRMLEELAIDRSASTASRSGAALASVLAASGETAAARAAMVRVLSQQYRDHHVAYSVGTAHAQLGDAAESLRWLRSAADSGFPCLVFYMWDPLLAPLRTHPDFLVLASELRRRRDEAAARHGPR